MRRKKDFQNLNGIGQKSHNKVFFSGGLLQHTAAGGDSKFQMEYWWGFLDEVGN